MSTTCSDTSESKMTCISTLVWHSYPFLWNYNTYFQHISPCDPIKPEVALICKDDVLLRAHKVVLSLASAQFENLFKMYKPWEQVDVKLRMIPAIVMYDVLSCLYQGRVTIQQDRVEAILSVVINLGISGISVLPVAQIPSKENSLTLLPGEETSVKQTPPPVPSYSSSMDMQHTDLYAEVSSHTFLANAAVICSPQTISYPSRNFSAHRAYPEPLVINLADDDEGEGAGGATNPEIDPGTEPAPPSVDLTSHLVLASKQRKDRKKRKTEEGLAHEDASTPEVVTLTEMATPQTFLENGTAKDAGGDKYVPGVYDCLICRVSINNQENLKQHMSIMHPGYTEQAAGHGAASSTSIRHDCNFCKLKFNMFKEMKEHFRRDHSGEKFVKGPQFVCKFCNMPFYFKQSLRLHEKISHVVQKH